MNELWRNIDGYKGMYQVSSLGRVRSYKSKKEWILKPGKNNSGYLYVNLCQDGKYKSMSVHRLVATYFLGKSSLVVNHKDGDKLNNILGNLEWISDSDNRKHAKENGLLASGERNGMHKLTRQEVELIRTKYKEGKKLRFLSREFGVSRQVITKIIKFINWK